jgi:pilus assembly protein FimV
MEAARDQYAQLQVIGDQPSLLEADRILRGDSEEADGAVGELPLDLEIGDFSPPSSEGLDMDFAGLEIEDESGVFSDELDLSEDFDVTSRAADTMQGEDLVYAAEGNEMSTKLDLARAYIDMGDEDGARQILEEVASEGSEEQRQEAGRLIQRLG